MLNQKLRTMRNIFKFMLFIAAGAMILVSCEEDKFTEKDAMDALQTIDVALTIQDGSSYAEGVEGATVKVLKDSSSTTTLEKTTDASGYVIFEDMKIGGDISVYVNKDNYTKALFQVSTSTDSYRESQISKRVKIYPLDGENMATVKGQLTIETDLTNRQREKLANKEVKVINNDLGDNIEKSFVGTTDEEGKYSIKVPVNADGSDNIEVIFPSKIDTTQTLAMRKNGTNQIVTNPAVYYSNGYNPSSVYNIPSASVSIGAPNNIGSGFQLDVKAEPTSFNSYSELELLQGGSGYEQDTVKFSEGVNGNSALVAINVNSSPGPITSVDVLDNGAKYTSAPQLNLSGLSGSGAEMDVQFESDYLVYIKNHGEGYKSIPTVSATYKQYDVNTIVRKIDENLENHNEIGSYNFNDYVNLHNGSIYAADNWYTYGGDPLFVTEPMTEAPQLEVASSEGQQALIEIRDYHIDDSTITDYNLVKEGKGYDPSNPPEINVSSLSGYGSGAEFDLEVQSDGTIDHWDIVLKSGGDGYVRNVNNYNGISPGITGGSTNNVSPGEVREIGYYYGTGERKEN